MTPDARARLVEVMASAMHDDRWPGTPWITVSWMTQADYRGHADAAIAAAERAGFKWEESKT